MPMRLMLPPGPGVALGPVVGVRVGVAVGPVLQGPWSVHAPDVLVDGRSFWFHQLAL
jgi:hypothetical protein